MKNKKTKDSTIKRINEVYKYLVENAYSSFYKDKYKKAKINLKEISSYEDFKSLPFLTKEEILKEDPYRFLFVPESQIDHVGLSSGTTNQNIPLVMLMNSHGYPHNLMAKRFLNYYKLKIKKVMLLYSNFNILRRFQINYELTKHGVLMVPGDLNNLSTTAKITKRLQIEALETTSSILYYFIPYLKKEYDLDKIKLINLGGEFTSEQKFAYLKKTFKNAYFEFNFGGLELSNVGDRCEFLRNMPPRFFHINKHLYPEIINPDKEGELVLTSLVKGKWPFIIRYKTGNSVKLSEFVCPCGEKETFEVFGKIGLDVVKIQGAFIYSNKVYEALLPYSKFLQSPDFRLHIYEKVKKDKIQGKLVLQLVLKKKQQDIKKIKENLQKKISENLYITANSSFSDLVEKKIFAPLEIEFVDNLAFSPKQTNIISHVS